MLSCLVGSLKEMQALTLLRRILGPTGDDTRIIRGWRKLHTEEFHNVYCSPSIIRMIKSKRMKWTVDVRCMGRSGKSGGKSPLGKPRPRILDEVV
jgi:hypothetical protein